MSDALHESAIQRVQSLQRFAGPLIIVAAACGSTETTRRTSPGAAGAGGASSPGAAGAGGDSTPGTAGAGGDSSPGAAGAGGDSTPGTAGAGGTSSPCAGICEPTAVLELADDGYRGEAERGESQCFELVDESVIRVVCWETDIDHLRVNGEPVSCVIGGGSPISGGSYCIELEGPSDSYAPEQDFTGGILVTWLVD